MKRDGGRIPRETRGLKGWFADLPGGAEIGAATAICPIPDFGGPGSVGNADFFSGFMGL